MRFIGLAVVTCLSGCWVMASGTAGAAPRITGAPLVAGAPRIAGAPKVVGAPRKAAAVQKGRAPKPAGSAAPEETSEVAPEEAVPASAGSPEGARPAATPAEDSDTKIDDKPPPSVKGAGGPNLSPLNPEPAESPKASPAAGPEALDKLIADIATLRARVAALTTSLFSSKLKVFVHTDGDDARVQTFVVTLDDGVVFKGDPGFFAEDEKVVYEHAVAPGSHVIGIEIERQDTRGAQYRTWQTNRFAIQVPERQVLEAIVVVEDDSDMADDFPDDQDGKYELGVRLRAKVVR
jgi:hypothetical protein